MIFVDASAIVAIMTREPGHETLILALESAAAAITSPISVYEATAGLCRKRQISVADARQRVASFLGLSQITILAISPAAGDAALDAFDRFGKGRGNAAQLNLGDCFAYAMAKCHDAALLFTGNDFTATDIPIAMQSPPSLSGKME
jgi:ribonuclease VapC